MTCLAILLWDCHFRFLTSLSVIRILNAKVLFTSRKIGYPVKISLFPVNQDLETFSKVFELRTNPLEMAGLMVSIEVNPIHE